MEEIKQKWIEITVKIEKSKGYELKRCLGYIFTYFYIFEKNYEELVKYIYNYKLYFGFKFDEFSRLLHTI